VQQRGRTENNTHIPLSQTAIHSILKQWSIHHSTDATVCPSCKLLRDYGNEQPPPRGLRGLALRKWQINLKKQKESHHAIAKIQHQANKQQKEDLVNNKKTDTIIITQDFTQLVPQTGFNQDLIQTFHTYDEQAPDKIRKRYHHYVGEGDTKNDIFFVIAVWEHIFKNNLIPQHITTIHIWSDGGPKHFKITACMYYFSLLAHRFKKTITYHFYQSYHGHNICDAAASHAKKQISEQQRNNDELFYVATDLAESINTLNYHIAQVAPPINIAPLTIKTMDGIKSFFMFKFPKLGTIHAHKTSKEENYKTYIVKPKVFPIASQ